MFDGLIFSDKLVLLNMIHSSLFYHTASSVWSLTYFFGIFYIILIFSAICYLVSNIKDFTQYTAFSNSTNFQLVSGIELSQLLFTPLLILWLLNSSWTGPTLMSWFGHILWSSFQAHVVLFIILFFGLIWVAYSLSFYYSSQEVYDYTIVSYSFFIWVYFLFFANNILTIIFFIEIISTLIMLMIITSTFSSTYFYNNLNLDHHTYFNQTTPTAFLQTVMFFFWISFLSSLTLFVFLNLLYLNLFTLEWYTLESILFYVISVSDIKAIFTLSMTWLTFLFCIFLKCGLVPFFFWKPLFFRGLSMHILFFYIVFFYFFIFLFFTYFFTIYLNELFYFNIFVNSTLLILGLTMLVFIICESFYIKAFLAMSSILNTLFVFLALNSYSVVDYLFFL